MWARVAELMLGWWLVLSPLIFRGTEAVGAFAARDIAVGAAVIACSLLSFWRRTEWAHFITAILGLGLGALAWAGWERPGPPAAQNEITLGLLLGLLAIVPNEASLPPLPWRAARRRVAATRDPGAAGSA